MCHIHAIGNLGQVFLLFFSWMGIMMGKCVRRIIHVSTYVFLDAWLKGVNQVTGIWVKLPLGNLICFADCLVNIYGTFEWIWQCLCTSFKKMYSLYWVKSKFYLYWHALIHCVFIGMVKPKDLGITKVSNNFSGSCVILNKVSSFMIKFW